jgi:hypothetical protein
MGTGTDSTDIKEEAKKRSHVMAKLYRGNLDILRTKHEALGNSLIAHIRSFDKTVDDNDSTYAESLGFWRMLVELIFQVYVQISLCVGILLVVLLVIFAWPVRFLIELFAGSILANQRIPVYYEPQIQPTMDPEPDPANTKVMRRMVYEETKVPKK